MPDKSTVKDAENFNMLPFGVSADTLEMRNINPSAFRVLYILLLLVRKKSLNIDEINKELIQHPHIARSYNTETMLKYINTLRKSGCKIPRVTKKNDYRYQLLNNPVPLNLSADEVSIAIEVEHLLQSHADKTLQVGYGKFINEVLWALPKDQQMALQQERIKASVKAMPHHEKTPEGKRLEKFQQYCTDEQLLTVTMVSDLRPDETVTRQIEPYDLVTGHGGKHQEDVFYLIGYDTLMQKNVKLDLSKVVDVRQMPLKIKREQVAMQVMFQVYGRLAKSYRLYPNEEVMFSQGDTLQVLATSTDTDALLSRLMKYGAACQVLSPISLRQAMKQRIKLLLEGLQA